MSDIGEKVKEMAAQDGAAVEEIGESSTSYELSGRIFAEDVSASPRHYTLEDAYRATLQLKARYVGD
jgi:hypothetical protein